MTIARNFGRGAVSVGYVLVGFALMLFHVSLAWTSGESLGFSPWERHIYGGMHVSMYVFGILAAFAICFFIVDNRKVFAALAALGMILVGAYDAVIGLVSQNQLGVVDAVAQNNRRVLTAYGAPRMHAINGWDLYAGRSASFDNSEAQQATFKKQEVEFQKRLDALRPLVAASATVSADGQSALLAHISRWWSGADDATITAENWQLRLAILVAIFPFEVTSFIFAGRVWRRDQQVAMSAEKPGFIASVATKEVTTEVSLPLVATATLASAATEGVATHVSTMPDASRYATKAKDLRHAPVSEHIDIMIGALRDLGLTKEVPAEVIHWLYPELMELRAVKPMSSNTFAMHFAKVCKRHRARIYREDGRHDLKTTVYDLPGEGPLEPQKNTRPTDANKSTLEDGAPQPSGTMTAPIIDLSEASRAGWHLITRTRPRGGCAGPLSFSEEACAEFALTRAR